MRSIVNSIQLPTTSADAAAMAFDLDGDGRMDNAFGRAAASLASALSGSAWQRRSDAALAQGEVLLLAEYIPIGDDATFTLFQGADPEQPPCAPDGTCGHHLDGTGAFSVAEGAPRTAPLTGAADGTFVGGPGELAVQVAFGPQPLTLHLRGAHVAFTAGPRVGDISEGVLAGAVTEDEMDTLLLPAAAAAFQEQIVAECTSLSSPPECGCAASSAAATALSLFDMDQDCAITPAEILAKEPTYMKLGPDVVIDGVPAVSFSVRFTAVPAAFTP
ncbi:MAG: hypothetical protein K8W52_09510 [Deltaproteobacteria bacterium]|nr:hypothetical protein [Deltaproteobacteria bacterium]